MENNIRILAINPGSTSTKISCFKNEELIFTEVLNHPAEIINSYDTIYDQFGFRREIILKTLMEKDVNLKELDAVDRLVNVGGRFPFLYQFLQIRPDLIFIDVYRIKVAVVIYECLEAVDIGLYRVVGISLKLQF